MPSRPSRAAARRPRGRPYKLPEDPTPIQAPVPGLTQRVAWLLGASRVHAADSALTRREDFIKALHEQQVPADSTRLSRWESGRMVVPGEVLTAYERLLGLAPGQLYATAAAVYRGAQLTAAPYRPIDEDPAAAHQQLDELFERVFAGGAPADGWIELTEVLTRQTRLYLMPDTWAKVAEACADEIARSTGLAYVARMESLRMLLRHPSARRHAARAVGGLTTNAAAEFVVHPLGLLAEVEEQQATDLLLRLLGDHPTSRRAGASWAIAGKLARGHFDEDGIDQLEGRTLDILHRAPRLVQRLDGLNVFVALPDDSQQRLLGGDVDPEVRRTLELVARQTELVRPEVARREAARLAEAVQAATVTGLLAVEPDLMLARLIREMLFHVSHDRRHQATLLLAASPYRPALAERLVDYAASAEESVAVPALSACFQIADVRQREALAALALRSGSAGVRMTSLVALAHVTRQLEEEWVDQLLRELESADGLTPAIMHLLGMTGSERLRDLADHPQHGSAAEWWLERTAVSGASAYVG